MFSTHGLHGNSLCSGRMEIFMKKYFTPLSRKYFVLIIALLFLIIPLAGCNHKKNPNPVLVADQDKAQKNNNETSITPIPSKEIDETKEAFAPPTSLIVKDGTTLEGRIQAPAGYSRIPTQEKGLTQFLRNLELKPDGSDVLLYDGSAKGNQADHAAVFNLDVGNRDLQQCADSVMRVYAEYYWSIEAYDKIAFHLTNGFLMEYTKWRDGNRLKVDGNHVSWVKSKSYDDSYEEFRNYLTMVFAYAGTLSLSEESSSISPEEIMPGDMFLQGGSPGHCVLVVDVAIDSQGNRSFLLAQGYMPAQEFHIIKNPLHEEDPWYYTSELAYPFKTPLWTFKEGTLVRWMDIVSADMTVSENDAAASSVTLLAVGDNLIHTEVVNSGLKEDGSYNYDHLYRNVKDTISEADIAVINQETILGGSEFGYSGYPNFNSPTEIGDAVIEAGFDVVLHATNHTMDKGYSAVENTFAYWEKFPQITVLGINETQEDKEQIPIIEKNGIKIAMLNYTYGLNGYTVPKDKPYLVNMLQKEEMKEDIEKAEELADFTIVFPHWGSEYVYEATKAQKDLTEFFYDLGVDLVIGTHPHVLEPVEWIETDGSHRMLVYYSLGNFMSYQKEAPRMLGGMAEITLTKDNQGTYISDSSITPIVTHYENGSDDFNYAIYPLTDYTEELATLHGVSDIAKNGPLTFDETFDLAKQVLGTWFR